jgi:hypothetical protein
MFEAFFLRPSTGFNKPTSSTFLGYLIPWKWNRKTPPKCQKLLVFNNHYCAMSQNTLIFINAALKLLNFSTCRNISYKNYYKMFCYSETDDANEENNRFTNIVFLTFVVKIFTFKLQGETTITLNISTLQQHLYYKKLRISLPSVACLKSKH